MEGNHIDMAMVQPIEKLDDGRRKGAELLGVTCHFVMCRHFRVGNSCHDTDSPGQPTHYGRT